MKVSFLSRVCKGSVDTTVDHFRIAYKAIILVKVANMTYMLSALVGSHNTQRGRGTLNSMCLVKDSDSKEIWTHNPLS